MGWFARPGLSLFAVVLISLIAATDRFTPAACAADESGKSLLQHTTPRSPEESLAAWHVKEGYEIELVVAEPLVIDPVAIDWGADGKLWVAEMHDYPSGIDGEGKAGGRIRLLEDTDGDGRYDKSTIFLDGINFPTGVMAWKGGVLVTAAPELFYAEDTDGDGRADVRKTLYSGFHQGNQQLRVNGLRWGLDNWVYCGSGSHHGGYGAGNQIKAHLLDKDIEVGSRDFRIRPDTGEIDPQAGPSQFGRNRDDWGNWFGVQNSYPAWHYVLADHYMRRNPHFAPPDPRKIFTTSNPPCYPATPPLDRFHNVDHTGRFTSACSAVIYRDELLFPRGSAQHVFTCEPVHNLVQRNILTESGVSFDFEHDPSEEKLDFLASEDPWTRPVMVRTGPDGALWVVDMYRYMIEHPHWLTQKGKELLRPMYRAGDDRGRLYRVYPKGKRPRTVPRLDKMTGAELVAVLESPNGWQRDMAQRLLVERQEASTIPALQQLARTSESPLARLHALYTLDGMGALDAALLIERLADEHPGVRRHALRLAEPLGTENAELRQAALTLTDDSNLALRLQLTYTLGQWNTPEAAQALAKLAIASTGDTYLLAAVMSSLNAENVVEVLRSVKQANSQSSAAHEELLGRLLEQAIAMQRDDALAIVLPVTSEASDVRYEPWQMTALAYALDGLSRHPGKLDTVLPTLQPLLQHARQVALDTETPLSARRAAVRLLLRERKQRAEDLEAVSELLAPQTPAELQSDLVEQIGKQNDVRAVELLLDGWAGYGPARRNQVLAVVSGRPASIKMLLAALDAGTLKAGEIDPIARERLLAHKDKNLRGELAKRLNVASSSDRQQVMSQFKSALELTGDIERGKVVFRNKCATCHKQDGVGNEVGPNLDSLTNRTPEALFEAILDPNAGVEAKYVSYAAITVDGRVRTGIIALETGNSITLLGADGKSEVILRSDIEELRSTGKSLMPEGLEAELSPQDLADLLKMLSQKPAAAE